MKPQENTNLVRRTVTLSHEIIKAVGDQAHKAEREFSAELRNIIRKGLGK